jgi:hypothetical protein
MKQKLLLTCGLFLASHAAAAAPTHAELFDRLIPIMQDHRVSELDLCIDAVCENYSGLVWDRKTVSDKPGVDDLVGAEGHGAAAAVGDIVGQVGKQVGAGGRIVVDYEKKTDGSLKIRVEASFGVGSAAAGAASVAPPQNPKDL